MQNCGLTISDIDFKEHTINIDHQLQKKSKIGYYIQETKTTSGTRKIPMTADVEECFQKIIEKRNPPKAEPMVDGKSGFLYFDKNGSICYSLHWEHYFQHIIQKYNNTYKVQMSVITSACMSAYLLLKYGKIRNESKSIAIFDGALRHQRNAEYIYACKS